METEDCDIIVPWDRHFASQEEAVAAFRSSGWHEPSSGLLYNERFWTLGAALRWIAERSQEAVDRPFASDARVHEAVGELQEALEAGEITLSQMLHEWALHDIGHIRQVAELVRARKYLAGAGRLGESYQLKP